jgi:trans-aconitate methyltransferase
MVETKRKEQGSAYYDAAYTKAQKAYNVHYTKSRYYKMFQAVMAFMPDNKSIPVLDIGCGPGQLTAMLADNGWNVFGFDYSPKAIEMAQRLFPQHSHRFYCADMRQMTVHNGDTVIMTEVLEHIQDDLEILKRFSVDRHVILTVPSFDDPAHVRYFTSTADVTQRYGPMFKNFAILKVGPWFVFYGDNTSQDRVCEKTQARLENMVKPVPRTRKGGENV